ncbi:MAG: aldehyde dehydrogenase EutE [Armatimonadetes bacterium CG_4_10_14_3_um_filter_66_18]|nr:aldehyde dehydrogenase family protein [Armatimonadota bacterium]OIP06326.1 MAG: hypothetical protein AUJ96_09385 [Armatimonadetes bacterium CG2_30_66_41]PIU92864.1 MAG: aldehyde dehydrogenase EutE [Armatimonadetes bacterium CG06_land_8_20_14_3_00_66_21]PIW12816.1 MAG: aldehyde dehydrogenase EutE [Armatimonadetes bacterium CG17_big_fil_post_rev_8_21_14_2_50_66_6]PIX47203.1 MAG: aldehyde dehydrogenase EutE [Armatimonadetes bacterium CG_4_8_14_3_um_filter_66_20]PIY35915.1 MAG: aldehyde dehydro
MRIDQIQIEQIVSEVMRNLQGGAGAQRPTPAASPTPAAPAASGDLSRLAGVFETVDQCVAAAAKAQQELAALPLAKRGEIVQAIRAAGVARADEMARMAVAETQMGRAEHKVQKNLNCAKFTPGVEDLKATIHRGQYGMTMTELIPFGVVCAVTPVTNPTSTIINNGIMFIAGGNAAVFCPHPAATKCTLTMMALLNDAIRAAGGPPNLLTSVAKPTLRTVKEAMDHKGTNIICATGGPALVKAALESPKRAVCAGPGNPPALVDSTANLAQAARDCVAGASFDNNVICIAEKEFIVEDSVADEFMRELERNEAYRLTGAEASRVAEIAMVDGHPNRDFIGRHASTILEAAGIRVSGDPKIAFLEAQPRDVLVMEEQMMPIIPVVRARNFDQAMDLAKTAEGGRRHTIVIHSRNTDNITRFLNATKPTIFVANGPSTAGDAAEGEGHLAMTLAGPTGEGFTRPSSFCRERRIALAGGTLAVM